MEFAEQQATERRLHLMALVTHEAMTENRAATGMRSLPALVMVSAWTYASLSPWWPATI
jgi:hypothetical protein